MDGPLRGESKMENGPYVEETFTVSLNETPGYFRWPFVYVNP